MRPLSARFQPILLLDACRLHLHRSLAQVCSQEGIWLVVIPAKLTWLLQPCDTHAFLEYKAYLKAEHQRMQIATGAGELSTSDFLHAMCQTIRFVLQGRRWAPAFCKNGFGAPPCQGDVSGYILRQLELDAAPAVCAARPSEAVLRLCYPRRATIPQAALLNPVAPMAAAPSAGPVAPMALAPGAGPRLPRPHGIRLMPRPLALPSAVAQPAPSGPVTRSQSRLVAALAQGRDLPRQGPKRPSKRDRAL